MDFLIGSLTGTYGDKYTVFRYFALYVVLLNPGFPCFLLLLFSTSPCHAFSALGVYDGKVYEALWDRAQKDPLNDAEVPDGYEVRWAGCESWDVVVGRREVEVWDGEG